MKDRRRMLRGSNVLRDSDFRGETWEVEEEEGQVGRNLDDLREEGSWPGRIIKIPRKPEALYCSAGLWRFAGGDPERLSLVKYGRI